MSPGLMNPNNAQLAIPPKLKHRSLLPLMPLLNHNNATQLHDLKWAISINAVKELVSDVTKSQRLVDKAIKKRQAEIDAHHAQHQLEPSHNHRHKRKRTIRESIPFTSAQT